MERLKKNLIGKLAYPVDNSEQYNLVTGQKTYLAGFIDEYPKQVLIVSEPYQIHVDTLWGSDAGEWEFVTVLYKGEPHICLNHFTEVPTEPGEID